MLKLKKILVFIFVFCACAASSKNVAKLMIKIIPKNGSPVLVNAEVASTQTEQMRGLMYRQKLEADAGMLFIFPKEHLMSFWMKNTYINLDLIFADSSKKITEILHGQAFSEDILQPYRMYKYVLEVNAGFAEKNHIQAGDKLEF